MRKFLVIPFTIFSVAACLALYSFFLPDKSLPTDKAFHIFHAVSAMEKTQNISADELYTEDPFRVAAVEEGDTSPARTILGLLQNNKITGAASYAAFMNSEIDLSQVDVALQTSILTDMIGSYQYGENKLSLLSGTGAGLQGDTAELESLIHKNGKTVSFMAIRLRDGASIGYNADQFFQSCSTIKIPMTLYAAKLIEQGTASYDSVFTYTSDVYISGSGLIKNSALGSRYKLKTLITYAITESDNIAYQMICANLGIRNLYRYFEEIGVSVKPENNANSSFWPDSNARSAALWWSQVYLYKDSGDVGRWYWDLLQKAPSRIHTALYHEKECYTKSGSSTYCLHEAGIVAGDDPYLVVIFTRSSTAAGNTESYFYQLARAIDKLICS